MQYSNDHHAKYRDFNDPNSWYCEGPSSPAPAPAPQPAQQQPAQQQSQPAQQPAQNSGSNSGGSGQQPSSDSRYHGSSSPLSGNYIRVNVTGLRIRTGPSENNTILGHLVYHEYYQLLEKSGSWGKVSTSRGQGWAHLGYATVYGEQSQKNEWCSKEPSFAGFIGFSGVNPRYQLYFSSDTNLGYLSGNYYFYYRGQYVEPGVANLEGFNNERNEWQVGVDTTWATTHEPNWRYESNWRVDYPCQ